MPWQTKELGYSSAQLEATQRQTTKGSLLFCQSPCPSVRASLSAAHTLLMKLTVATLCITTPESLEGLLERIPQLTE